MSDFALNPKLFDADVEQEATRTGFGRGLKKAGQQNENIVALCADLTESTQMSKFRDAFTDRFIEVGVAEQNLVTVASGMAHMGKIPFTSSYAAFSPGRNWEQIRTTICLNNQPVKIVGSHAGVSVGLDGATHQMLEDIALMRVLPNMIVVAPGDSIEAEKATLAIAANNKPTYLRLARDKSPIFSTLDSPFEIGKAYKLRQGRDITFIGTGIMSAQLLIAADVLSHEGIEAEVIHCPTIKPLDGETILASLRSTGRALTAEEGQIIGGLGGAVAELLIEKLPLPLKRVGINDRFGESGQPDELIKKFCLSGEEIAQTARAFVRSVPQYQQGY